MDLFRMQCFLSAAEKLNFTQAAGEVGITQSAMSVQMRELEKEVGAKLFLREKGRMTLTDAGREAREGFADILGMYDRTLRRIRRAGAGGSHAIKTGYHGALTAFSPLYRSFHDAHPDIETSVRIAEWDVLADMLLSGELDVAFVERHEVEIRPGLDWRPFIDEPYFCVAMHCDHPLASSSSLTVEQLAGERILMSGYRSVSMDWMYRQLLTNGISRELITFVDNAEAEIAMSSAGAGLAAMPRFLAMPGNPSVTWVPVRCDEYSCSILVAWRRGDERPELACFVDHCLKPDVVAQNRASWPAGLEEAR